jgi:guanylate kinase
MTKKMGKLYIIAAPSGTGKTSLVDALLKTIPNVALSISHTTRPRRDGEEEGIHYHFTAKETFENMIAEHAFLEYAQVYGNLYGTSKVWLEETIGKGRNKFEKFLLTLSASLYSLLQNKV